VKALIVGSARSSGGVDHADLVARLAAEADLVIAADGGGALCLEAGILPALVVGDLDSLPPRDGADLEAADVRFVRVPSDKDETDLDIAIGEARAMQAHSLVATGVLGGRLDHTLASLGSLASAAELEPIVTEPDTTVWIMSNGAREQLDLAGVGATVSLLAWCEPAVVTCQGFRYPLRSTTLAPLSSLGMSNVTTGADATITVSSGTLLVVTTSVGELRQASQRA